MSLKKFLWMISLGLIVLVITACGQVSVEVIPSQIPNTPDSSAPTTVVEPSPEVSTPEVSPPTVEVETTEPEAPVSPIPSMAYLGEDGNVWVLEPSSGGPRQITFDANPLGPNSTATAVEYGFPRLSSDSTLLAYTKGVGEPIESGYNFTYSTWVINLGTGELRQILNTYPAGMDWKPGTHLLAYGTVVDTEYFMSRGEPAPELAHGIRGFDMERGEIVELVAPERGYTLSSPQWSPDGRFLAFSEVVLMEGSGMFAYYDFETQQYVAWGEPVGLVSWSADSEYLAYARLTYVPTGEERLYLRPRQGSEQLLGPDYAGPAYATQPVFSPAGDQIAYLAFLNGPESQTADIMVLDLAGGEPKKLGQFDGVWELFWVPDGSHVVFSFGMYEARYIVALNVADGSQTPLVTGTQPALAGD